jgi:hypothetical protein
MFDNKIDLITGGAIKNPKTAYSRTKMNGMMIFFVVNTFAKVETTAIKNLLLFPNNVLEYSSVSSLSLSRDFKFVREDIKIHAKKARIGQTTIIDQ